jgi:hypothetical protein
VERVILSKARVIERVGEEINDIDVDFKIFGFPMVSGSFYSRYPDVTEITESAEVLHKTTVGAPRHSPDREEG